MDPHNGAAVAAAPSVLSHGRSGAELDLVFGELEELSVDQQSGGGGGVGRVDRQALVDEPPVFVGTPRALQNQRFFVDEPAVYSFTGLQKGLVSPSAAGGGGGADGESSISSETRMMYRLFRAGIGLTALGYDAIAAAKDQGDTPAPSHSALSAFTACGDGGGGRDQAGTGSLRHLSVTTTAIACSRGGVMSWPDM